MLASPELEPLYGEVTWLFVTRNFEDDAGDREAARTHDRFGISSWPQLLVFDPRGDAVVARPPRDLAGFKRALESTRGTVPRPGSADRRALERLAEARELHAQGKERLARPILEELAEARDGVGAWSEARELLRWWWRDRRDLEERLGDPDVRERALALEEIADRPAAEASVALVKSVTEMLLDPEEHLIVRVRALRWLVGITPEKIAEHGAELLRVPNDPFRFQVLEAVERHPDPELAGLLIELYQGAGGTVPSENPNVLRSWAARCLAGSGDGEAIDVLAGTARAADPLNGTTGAVVDALAGIAPRIAKQDRRRVVAILLESFPRAVDDPAHGPDAHPALPRYTERHAARVAEALAVASGVSSLPELPNSWTGAERERYLEAVAKAVRGRPR